MKQNLLAIVLFLLFTIPSNAQTIDLIPHAFGLSQPVDIASAGDDRLFIVEREGRIRIVERDGTVLPEPFLDITEQVRSSAQDQGLLSIAFHPDYANNGYFYLNYTSHPSGDTFIARYSASSSNPNLANPNSRFIIYTAFQPYNNNNGGDLNFGPDGYLYIALGDGGSGDDPGNRAQNLDLPLGKILRIDIDSGVLYDIPPDNPYAQPGEMGLDEIWASGLRQPWRFSFDSETGDMWIADIGQDGWEEVNFQSAASAGGENYGWRCYEGLESFNASGCASVDDLSFPIHIYANNENDSGCSVTGGYVYRGGAFESLQGLYIYADYCTGKFWSLKFLPGTGWFNEPLGESFSYNFRTFGEDNRKELYVAGVGNGAIYRVVDPTALPIDLISFTAESIDNKEVVLKWLTATEINSDYFDIQRSLDGVSFSTIDKVNAAGNSTTQLSYEFTDKNPAFGEIYYRLRQVDFDGSVTYSEVKQVKLDRNYVTPNIYPNPIRDAQNLTIDFGDMPNSPVEINIVDMSGKQVYYRQYPAGQNRFDIPVNGLSKGMYIVNGQFDEYHFYKKLIVH